MIKKVWHKLFGRGPLWTTKEVEFMGHKVQVQVYNKKRMDEIFDAVDSGTIVYTSPRTYVLVNHIDDDFQLGNPPTGGSAPECCDPEGDCENCKLHIEEEESNGC